MEELNYSFVEWKIGCDEALVAVFSLLPAEVSVKTTIFERQDERHDW
jgi:hypothetical protein